MPGVLPAEVPTYRLYVMRGMYKALWLGAVALPLRSAGELSGGALEMTWVFVIGGVLDLLVIPWPYVWESFVQAPGDRWRFGGDAQQGIAEIQSRWTAFQIDR